MVVPSYVLAATREKIEVVLREHAASLANASQKVGEIIHLVIQLMDEENAEQNRRIAATDVTHWQKIDDCPEGDPSCTEVKRAEDEGMPPHPATNGDHVPPRKRVVLGEET